MANYLLLNVLELTLRGWLYSPQWPSCKCSWQSCQSRTSKTHLGQSTLWEPLLLGFSFGVEHPLLQLSVPIFSEFSLYFHEFRWLPGAAQLWWLLPHRPKKDRKHRFQRACRYQWSECWQSWERMRAAIQIPWVPRPVEPGLVPLRRTWVVVRCNVWGFCSILFGLSQGCSKINNN